jgi:hypothetical protein
MSPGLPCPGYSERDSRGGFDGIGVEGEFVDCAGALSLVYFGCTEIVVIDTTCRNPSFGLATKARGCKVVGQKEGSLGVKKKGARESKGRKPGNQKEGSP